MDETKRKIGKACKKFDAGRMTRRSFLSKLAALGGTAAVANAVSLSPFGAARAWAAISGPEERAWALAKEAAARPPKRP
jgi:multiple sugar transport system substrate-binding protein